MGLPPNPIAPIDASHVTLATGVQLLGDGTAYSLTAGGHTFAVRFESTPAIAGSVVSFQGMLQMRLIPGSPPI